jgi:hypothetical protein
MIRLSNKYTIRRQILFTPQLSSLTRFRRNTRCRLPLPLISQPVRSTTPYRLRRHPVVCVRCLASSGPPLPPRRLQVPCRCGCLGYADPGSGGRRGGDHVRVRRVRPPHRLRRPAPLLYCARYLLLQDPVAPPLHCYARRTLGGRPSVGSNPGSSCSALIWDEFHRRSARFMGRRSRRWGREKRGWRPTPLAAGLLV